MELSIMDEQLLWAYMMAFNKPAWSHRMLRNGISNDEMESNWGYCLWFHKIVLGLVWFISWNSGPNKGAYSKMTKLIYKISSLLWQHYCHHAFAGLSQNKIVLGLVWFISWNSGPNKGAYSKMTKLIYKISSLLWQHYCHHAFAGLSQK